MAVVIEGRYFPNLILIPFFVEQLDMNLYEQSYNVDLYLPSCNVIFAQNKYREVALSGDVYIDCDSQPPSPLFEISPLAPTPGGVAFLKSNAYNLAVYLPDSTVRILQKDEVAAFRVPDAVNFRIVYKHCTCEGQEEKDFVVKDTSKVFREGIPMRYQLRGDAKLEDIIFLEYTMRGPGLLSIVSGELCILVRPVKFSFSAFTDVPAVDIYNVEAEVEVVTRCGEF